MSPFERRRSGASYLVRLWREPGASPEKGPARVYVRDLRSGEERYLKSPEQLADYLARQPAGGAADDGHAAARRKAG